MSLTAGGKSGRKRRFMKGRLIYKVEDGHSLRELMLTVCHEEDFIKYSNLSEVRRRRIIRLLHEAKEQGCLLSYKDLHLILLSSLATLKRDISYLRKHGVEIFIKNGLRPMRSADCGSNG